MSASASWTRLAFLAHGQNRAEAENRCTVAGVRAPIGAFPVVRPDVAASRVAAGPALEELVAGMKRPGVALVAVDKAGTVAGTLALAGKDGAINAGVIGRHGRCDLYLAGDESLSLRHASIVVDERGAFRLIDLRTGTGLRDAAGRRHDGIASTDEAAITIGDHVVVARARRAADLDGPMRSPWAPPLALGTKVVDPPRTAAGSSPNQLSALATGVGVVGVARPGDDANLAVTITGGVTRTGGALLGRDEDRQALIELADAGAREQWPIGDRALANGILLGRYERCDGHGSRILARRGISRVHALVVAVDGIAYVMDLGSTNGTWVDGAEVKVARLAPGCTFRLGERGPSITWRAGN
jgi:hypothetical protein